MISEDCVDRLVNWKFDRAEDFLTDDATLQEREVVQALARAFGNSGWFFGYMGVIVRNALRSIGVNDDD
jgi:hypothetical protein